MKLLPLLFLLALPAVVQAQLLFTTNSGAITITGYTGSPTVVNIPSTTNGYPVTSIGGYAFSFCSSLTSVTIPNSVTSIGEAAFDGCSGLPSVTIPNSVISIGDFAFGACSSLTNISVAADNPAYTSVSGKLFDKQQTTLVVFPAGLAGSYVIPTSVTSIGEAAFYGCSGLTSITIPNSVTSIGGWAFYSCYLLTITIPNSVTSIGDGTFYACAFLTSITIPNSVTSIGNGAFEGCYGLTNVTIPNSVTSIGDEAFEYCYSLTSVTIPQSVTSIGNSAFSDCSKKLTAAYFQGNAPTNDGTAFRYDSNATVYYLPGTTGWGTTFGGRWTALWTLPYPVILSGNTSLGVQNNQFGFNVSWATNVPVVVLATTNLAKPVWTPVSTNALTNGTFYFKDPNWTNYSGRFYRVR